MSIFGKIGHGFLDVFNFLGSPKGQTIIATGEAVVEALNPGSVGLINLVNKWATEALKAEALAAAAGVQTGSGAQKSAMVLNAMVPEVAAFLKANGEVSSITAAQMKVANDALVAFLNALTPAAPAGGAQ